jgi:hypothetical protein
MRRVDGLGSHSGAQIRRDSTGGNDLQGFHQDWQGSEQKEQTIAG